MSIDHSGTAPGLVPSAKVQDAKVNMRCKGEGCDSMEAVEIKIEGQEHSGQRVYRCVKCSRPASVQVGGHINI